MELVSGVVEMVGSKVRIGGQKDRRPGGGGGSNCVKMDLGTKQLLIALGCH